MGADALIVPRDAVVRRPDGSETIWTIEVEDGVTKAAPRVVRTGRVYRNNVEVLSDNLEPGTQVVVRGNEILRPGQPVTVTEERTNGYLTLSVRIRGQQASHSGRRDPDRLCLWDQCRLSRP